MKIAASVVAMSIASMFLGAIVGSACRAEDLVTTMIMQVAGAGTAVFVAWRLRAQFLPWRTIGLGAARARFFLAAILVGATMWYLNVRLMQLAPKHAGPGKRLHELVSQPALAAALVGVALVPAICEEVLFRGVLARALGRRVHVASAVFLSAVVFSLFHMSLVQAIPTLTFGVALGWIAIRADSALPTMVAHFLNNAIVTIVARGDAHAFAHWIDRNATVALVGCAGATGAGLAIAARRTA